MCVRAGKRNEGVGISYWSNHTISFLHVCIRLIPRALAIALLYFDFSNLSSCSTETTQQKTSLTGSIRYCGSCTSNYKLDACKQEDIKMICTVLHTRYYAARFMHLPTCTLLRFFDGRGRVSGCGSRRGFTR